jgi:hypothetical protein
MAGLAVLVGAGFVWAWHRATGAKGCRQVLLAAAVVAGVLAGGAVAALSGLLAHFERRPPPLLLFLAVIFAFALALGFSTVGKRMAEGLPVWLLIALQSFRLPTELIMHQAAIEGVMPVQMSYSGWNFDIVTGSSALIVAALARRGLLSRGWLIAWNVMGCLLLANILAVAIASTPVFRAFGSEAAKVNTWVVYFPFVWLPGLLVPAAIFGHVVILRRLLRQRS